MLYTGMLDLHSLLRWVVLIAGVAAVIKSLIGWRGARPWTRSDHTLGMVFNIGLDLQLLIGLLLFFWLSPITTSAMRDMGAAMQNDVIRFFLVEHFPLMLIALIIAHIGRARARKAADDASRHRTTFIFYAVALLLILLAIPWPFMSYGRPLL